MLLFKMVYFRLFIIIILFFFAFSYSNSLNVSSLSLHSVYLLIIVLSNLELEKIVKIIIFSVHNIIKAFCMT